MKFTINLILFFTLNQYCLCISLRYGCPTDPTALRPCKCTQTFEKTNWKTLVTCSGFTDYTKLKLSLNALNGYRIDELLLNKLNLDYLPNNPFVDKDDKTITEISIVSIQKSRIGDIVEPNPDGKHSFFSGLGSSLTELRVDSCGKIDWNWTSLSNSLCYNSAGSKLELKKLLFYNNIIGSLGTTFDDMGKFNIAFGVEIDIERLILQWNAIQTIEASLTFPKMYLLDLSWNQLVTTGNLFKDVTGMNIQTVLLKNNRITTIDNNDPFWNQVKDLNANLPDLKYIDLRENPIDCGTQCTKVGWIKGIATKTTIDAKCYSPKSEVGKSITTCS